MTVLQGLELVGIASIVAALIYIGRKLQVLDDLAAASEKIKQNLKVVSDFMVGNFTSFDPKELQTYSPVQLTPEGQKLIDTLGFDDTFDAHKQEFFQYIDNDNPKFKYDVELAAIKSISGLYNKDYMQFLKVYLYNNPKRSVANIAPTLGIYVRNKYLDEHSDITE